MRPDSPIADAALPSLAPRLRDAIRRDAEALMEDLMAASRGLERIDPERPVGLARRAELMRLSAQLSRIAAWSLNGADAPAPGSAPETAYPAPEFAVFAQRLDRLSARAARVAATAN